MDQPTLTGTRPRATLQTWAWSALVLLWASLSIALWWTQNSIVSTLPGADVPGLWELLDWQPERWSVQPWRLWSAALVHWSGAHLTLNLVGCAGLLAWGKAAELGIQPSLAWLCAWPLTQLLLLNSFGLEHYGGLSGVLHAGVAIGAWSLVRAPSRARQWIGAAVLAGLLVKLMTEVPSMTPWLGLRTSPAPLPGAPGYTVAPYAHLSGVLAGLACAGLVDFSSICVLWLRGLRA